MITNIIIGLITLTVAISAVTSIYKYYKESKQSHKNKLNDYLPVRVRRNELISWLHTLIFAIMLITQYTRFHDMEDNIIKLQNQLMTTQQQMIDYIKQHTNRIKSQIRDKENKSKSTHDSDSEHTSISMQ